MKTNTNTLRKNKIVKFLIKRYLFVIWLIIGVCNLIQGVDNYNFSLCWISFLLVLWFKFPHKTK